MSVDSLQSGVNDALSKELTRLYHGKTYCTEIRSMPGAQQYYLTKATLKYGYSQEEYDAMVESLKKELDSLLATITATCYGHFLVEIANDDFMQTHHIVASFYVAGESTVKLSFIAPIDRSLLPVCDKCGKRSCLEHTPLPPGAPNINLESSSSGPPPGTDYHTFHPPQPPPSDFPFPPAGDATDPRDW